ncbi:MAG: hypothetical protein ACRD0Y_08125, partial [Terriglobales bacterium]
MKRNRAAPAAKAPVRIDAPDPFLQHGATIVAICEQQQAPLLLQFLMALPLKKILELMKMAPVLAG